MHDLRLSRHVLLALALLASAAVPARADVLIESVDAKGNAVRVLAAATAARIERDDSPLHVLLDFDAQTIHAVDPGQRFAMDMRSPAPERVEHGELDLSAFPPPAIGFERLGKGPRLVGFDTVQYRVLVDGQRCFDEYLAPATLDHPVLRTLLGQMARATDDAEHRILIQLMAPERLCDAAADLIDDHYPRLGMPLRTLDANGREIHRVTRIDLDASHESILFGVPPGYEVLTRAEAAAREASAPADPAEQAQRQQRLEELMRRHEDSGVE